MAHNPTSPDINHEGLLMKQPFMNHTQSHFSHKAQTVQLNGTIKPKEKSKEDITDYYLSHHNDSKFSG